MKLKFLRGVYPVATRGQVKDIEDRHAAEVYVAHGDAEVIGQAEGDMKSTLGPAGPKSKPPGGSANAAGAME